MKVTITNERVVIEFDNNPDIETIERMELHKELDRQDHERAKRIMAETTKIPVIYKPKPVKMYKRKLENHATKWTKEELETLKDLAYRGYKVRHIAKYIKRTDFAIARKLVELGVSLRKIHRETGQPIKNRIMNKPIRVMNKPIIQKTWLKGEDETLLNLLDKGYKQNEIAKMMNRTPASIYMRYRRLKMKAKGMSNWRAR